MGHDVEPSRNRTPIHRRALAGLVVLGVAALLIHAVIGLVLVVFWVVAAVAAVVAVLWALNTLL